MTQCFATFAGKKFAKQSLSLLIITGQYLDNASTITSGCYHPQRVIASSNLILVKYSRDEVGRVCEISWALWFLTGSLANPPYAQLYARAKTLAMDKEMLEIGCTLSWLSTKALKQSLARLTREYSTENWTHKKALVETASWNRKVNHPENLRKCLQMLDLEPEACKYLRGVHIIFKCIHKLGANNLRIKRNVELLLFNLGDSSSYYPLKSHLKQQREGFCMIFKEYLPYSQLIGIFMRTPLR